MTRYFALLAFTGLFVVGCGGGNKVEMPKDTKPAPTAKDVYSIGAGSEKGGGLPQPPGTGLPPTGGGAREPD